MESSKKHKEKKDKKKHKKGSRSCRRESHKKSHKSSCRKEKKRSIIPDFDSGDEKIRLISDEEAPNRDTEMHIEEKSSVCYREPSPDDLFDIDKLLDSELGEKNEAVVDRALKKQSRESAIEEFKRQNISNKDPVERITAERVTENNSHTKVDAVIADRALKKRRRESAIEEFKRGKNICSKDPVERITAERVTETYSHTEVDAAVVDRALQKRSRESAIEEFKRRQNISNKDPVERITAECVTENNSHTKVDAVIADRALKKRRRESAIEEFKRGKNICSKDPVERITAERVTETYSHTEVDAAVVDRVLKKRSRESAIEEFKRGKNICSKDPVERITAERVTETYSHTEVDAAVVDRVLKKRSRESAIEEFKRRQNISNKDPVERITAERVTENNSHTEVNPVIADRALKKRCRESAIEQFKRRQKICHKDPLERVTNEHVEENYNYTEVDRTVVDRALKKQSREHAIEEFKRHQNICIKDPICYTNKRVTKNYSCTEVNRSKPESFQKDKTVVIPFLTDEPGIKKEPPDDYTEEYFESERTEPQLSLSISETNKLRAKYGLKPLDGGSEIPGIRNSVVDSTDSEEELASDWAAKHQKIVNEKENTELQVLEMSHKEKERTPSNVNIFPNHNVNNIIHYQNYKYINISSCQNVVANIDFPNFQNSESIVNENYYLGQKTQMLIPHSPLQYREPKFPPPVFSPQLSNATQEKTSVSHSNFDCTFDITAENNNIQYCENTINFNATKNSIPAASFTSYSENYVNEITVDKLKKIIDCVKEADYKNRYQEDNNSLCSSEVYSLKNKSSIKEDEYMCANNVNFLTHDKDRHLGPSIPMPILQTPFQNREPRFPPPVISPQLSFYTYSDATRSRHTFETRFNNQDSNNYTPTILSPVSDVGMLSTIVPSDPAQASCSFEDIFLSTQCLIPSEVKSLIGSRIFKTEEVLLLILKWNVDSVIHRSKNQFPLISLPISTISFTFFEEFYKKIHPLLMLEIWEKLCRSYESRASKQFLALIRGYFIEDHHIIIKCVSMNHNTNETIVEPGTLIIIDYGSESDKPTSKIFGYVIESKLESCNPQTHPELNFTIKTTYNLEQFKFNLPLHIQVLYKLEYMLKQHDALIAIEHSPISKYILNPFSEGLLMFALKQNEFDKCVTDVIRNFSIPHPKPVMTFVRCNDKHEELKIVSLLIKEIKNKYKNMKILVCVRNRQTITDIIKVLKESQQDLKCIVILNNKLDIWEEYRNLILGDIVKKKIDEMSVEKEVTGDDICVIKKTIVLESDVFISWARDIHDASLVEKFSESNCIENMCCIIDEAQEFTETESLIPTLYGISKLIFIGNTMSKPNVFSHAAKAYNFDQSYFHRVCELRSFLSSD